jgi:16S rRNA processing protein RimM
MSVADPMVVMGQVLVPYGIQGWIKIRPFTTAPDSLLGYGEWWLRPPGANAWREVKHLAGRVHSDGILAQLDGIQTREQALALRGAEIAVTRGTLPEVGEGEFYRIDLIGLDVVNREGLHLGRVEKVLDFGAHPILCLASDERRERMVPFVPAHVDRVDLAGRRIDVDWQPDF